MAAIGAAPGLRLHGAAASLAEARAQIASHGPPDVLVTDLGLPDGDGTQLIRELALGAPATSLLVATVFGDEASVVRALEAGAHGYLLKDSAREDLVHAITSVRNGGSPLSPRVARYLLKRFATPSPASQPVVTLPGTEALSTREAQILTLISHGHTVPELAERLHLSVHTVNTHVKNIYGKLAVSNRVQAVNRGRETGQIR